MTRESKRARSWPLAIPLAIVLSGCNLGASTSTPQPQVLTVTASTPSPPSPSQSSGNGGECGHDYFPTDEGATWEYAGSNSYAGAFHQTVTITESRDDGFTMTFQASTDDVTLSLEYGCDDGNLTLLDPLQQFAAGSASGSGGTAVITTQGQTGVTLLADLQAGLTWQQTVQGTVQGPDVLLHGDYVFDNVARGLEVTTVPFGTFDAMRVDTEVQGKLEGEAQPPCQVTTWYAEDVGPIRTVFTCDMPGTALENTTELESYDSP
jgi:hypothetical protein